MSDFYSANNPAWSGYFRIKGRFASLIAMCVIPLLPMDYFWSMLAVALPSPPGRPPDASRAA